MKKELSIARCGLACCLCSENDKCKGCSIEGCKDFSWCEIRKCCLDSNIEACYKCNKKNCNKGLFKNKIKPKAFNEFIKRYSLDELLACLQRNEENGVIYHRNGIIGDYDDFDDIEQLIDFIKTGKRENLRLISLTKDYYFQLSEMIDEWQNDIKVNNTNDSPHAIFKNDYHDFDNYLNNLEYKQEQDGIVCDSVLFLYDETRDKLIGAVNIRHKLNEYLLERGGHIGDGIRPSERRKGYGTLIVKLALQECKKLGIDKVLMCCYKDNVGSKKTIINNGGVLENELIDENGNIILRYWINI